MSTRHADDRSLLYRLATRQQDATPPRLYRALTAEERRQAALAFMDAVDDGRDWLAPEVARAVNFRPELIEQWSNDRIAQHVPLVPFRTIAPRAQEFLVQLHLNTWRRAMLAKFLDGLGVKHDGGELDDPSALEGVEESRVVTAADQLLEDYDRDEVLVYLLTLALLPPELPGLREWIRKSFSDPPALMAEEAEVFEPAEVEPGAGAFDAIDEFTTLDQQIVFAVVETAQEVQGSASEDELDDLIEEVIQLNRSRQRSYFHAGFRDAVFDRDIPRSEREMNEQRARWYWAGVINGLARRKAWAEIALWYDSEAVVRSLGDTGEGPSYAAGQLVLLALARMERAPEAAEFLTTDALIHCDRLFFTAFQEGSQLLREDRAAEARGLLERLGTAVDAMEGRGIEPDTRLLLEVRRRRAHCYRQLKEFATAKELLHQLREEEPDPDLLSMILADLGLIEGGFRSLAEIRLPLNENGIPDLIARLDRGRSGFEEAVALGTRHGAHALYALGMLDLVKKQFTSAADRLELATSVFAGEARRYRTSGLLARANLALGLALANDLRDNRMQAAYELIADALRRGADMPAWAVVPTLESFAVHSPELAHRAAAAMVEHSEEELLDRIVEASAVTGSPPVLEAILRRARQADRPDYQKVADYRLILPGLLQERMFEEAQEALDYLEGAALAGEGTREFVALLSDPKNYQPVWDREDALWSSLHSLESAGRYEEAARAGETAFHQLLVEPLPYRVAQAEDLVHRIQQYGLPAEFTRALEARLDALDSDDAEQARPTATGVQADVRILFVGGNETQSQYDEQILQELEESHPRVSVSFIHSGWGSNWIQHYEDAERQLRSHDGLVIMRFIRTQLGRSLRKLASQTDKPWWSCAGSGKRSMKASILAAAAVVQERARKKVAAGGAGE